MINPKNIKRKKRKPIKGKVEKLYTETQYNELREMYDQRILDIKEERRYTETFYERCVKELPYHMSTSPETKSVLSKISNILSDKILLPKKWFAFSMAAILILLVVAIGVGYKGYKELQYVEYQLSEFELLE